jgi:hypothetical protein
VLPDGRNIQGQANPAFIRENIGFVYEEVFKRIESQLPPIFDFSGEETKTKSQKIPPNPLMVCTALLEDENGKISHDTQKRLF